MSAQTSHSCCHYSCYVGKSYQPNGSHRSRKLHTPVTDTVRWRDQHGDTHCVRGWGQRLNYGASWKFGRNEAATKSPPPRRAEARGVEGKTLFKNVMKGVVARFSAGWNTEQENGECK